MFCGARCQSVSQFHVVNKYSCNSRPILGRSQGALVSKWMSYTDKLLRVFLSVYLGIHLFPFSAIISTLGDIASVFRVIISIFLFTEPILWKRALPRWMSARNRATGTTCRSTFNSLWGNQRPLQTWMSSYNEEQGQGRSGVSSSKYPNLFQGA